MDRFDEKIIGALRENARQSVSSIAEKVNLSRSSVSERIKRLETTGVIRGYQVLLSESQKQEVAAYFEIRHCRRRTSEVTKLFKSIPEIQSCHGVSGDMDLLIYVRTESMQRLHEIREYLDGLEDLTQTKTHIVLSEWITN